jgi:hypothetical protein
MERSKIPLTKWLHAMYLLVTSRKGISSMQLSKELSIRQASAWFLLQRLREACGKNLDTLRGIVLKRGLNGVYHHASRKHLGRYVSEFAFRLNEGACKRHTIKRLDSLIAATVGKRITYAELTR